MSTLAPKGVKKKAALPGAILAQVAILLKAFCQLDSVSLLRQCLLAGSPSTQPAHSKNVWLKRPWMFSRRRPSTNQSHARGCFAWKKYGVSWVLLCWCMLSGPGVGTAPVCSAPVSRTTCALDTRLPQVTEWATSFTSSLGLKIELYTNGFDHRSHFGSSRCARVS